MFFHYQAAIFVMHSMFVVIILEGVGDEK